MAVLATSWPKREQRAALQRNRTSGGCSSKQWVPPHLAANLPHSLGVMATPGSASVSLLQNRYHWDTFGTVCKVPGAQLIELKKSSISWHFSCLGRHPRLLLWRKIIDRRIICELRTKASHCSGSNPSSDWESVFIPHIVVELLLL